MAPSQQLIKRSYDLFIEHGTANTFARYHKEIQYTIYKHADIFLAILIL